MRRVIEEIFNEIKVGKFQTTKPDNMLPVDLSGFLFMLLVTLDYLQGLRRSSHWLWRSHHRRKGHLA